MGPGRIELPTLRLSGARSNQLSYGPKNLRYRPSNVRRSNENYAQARPSQQLFYAKKRP